MTPQELLESTILSESAKDDTDFKKITHRGEERLAKVEYGDFRKASLSTSEIGQISDEISFLNVSLDTLKRGDNITFEDDMFHVEHYTNVTKNIYNIFATKKQTTTGRRLR